MTTSDTLPLSTAQRGMWIGQAVSPPGSIYNIAEAIELHGVIDPPLLQQALREVTREMETLRTRIVQRAGLPRQLVMDRFEDSIELLDFAGETDPRAAATQWMTREFSAPFDFASSALWVSTVLRLSDDHWFWYHRAHHIILDGYSGGMVVQRVAELYSALRQRRLPAPTAYGSLSTLIESEATYRASDRYARDRAYWMERMSDLPPAVTLTRRQPKLACGLMRATGILPVSVTHALREQIKGMNVSLPQALIALVAAYYFQMTGAEDLVFGMPVTARVSGVMRRCPGMVANALPIRLAMSWDMTTMELFAQVSRAVREALRHQQYRYEDLRRDLGLLNLSGHIARLGINIEPFDYELTFDGVPATPHNLSNGQMEDLTVFIYDRSDGNGLRIDIDANPALYGAAEMEAHQRRLCRLIETVATRPGMRLDEVSLLDAEEYDRITRGWNETSDTRTVATVPALFAQQVAMTPEAPAVLFDRHAAHTLTYRELDRRSSLLARRLVSQAIGAGDLVAVALPRSELVPVALMGIMRAGAAYLPLDLDTPPARLSLIWDDARPACVLTLPEYAVLFDGMSIPCLFMSELEDGEPEPVALPMPAASATAYLLYTSGSTGLPKGVEISHGSLSNLIEGMRQLLMTDQSTRFLAVTTFTFDIAGLELFLPLTTGARVIIAEPSTIRDPMAMSRLVQMHHVTLMQATPSLWRMLLSNRMANFSHVHALVGGEVLSRELALRLIERTRQAINVYGPTETTIWSTAMPLSADDVDPPPIGKPIRNTQVYVLDARLRPVPVGAVGMLYVGGQGLAKGYLHRDALTDECFIPNPFPGVAGRLYRTGDLARWHETGVLECLGRSDHQVKIRGHRIEPAEIETQLSRHRSVAEAVVIARPDSDGKVVLVAYVVATPGEVPSHEELRAHVASHLSSHMIPSIFVTMDALPQTANGKLNRNALPAPSLGTSKRRIPVPPRTETERVLVDIWRDALRRDDVGIHDNFFELGGDSLSGAQVVVAVTETFSWEIPFASLFQAPTIAELAVLFQNEAAFSMLETLLPLRATGSRPPLFCVHSIIGLGWSYASLIRHLHPEQPVYALQAAGLTPDVGEDDYPDSIEMMAKSYLTEIRQIQPCGPYHLLGWSLGGVVAHAIAGQLRRTGEEVSLLVLLDSYPFLTRNRGEEIDEAQQVSLALDFLGLQHEGSAEARAASVTTMTELADHLFRLYGLADQPIVQAMLRSNAGLVERLGYIVRRNLELIRLHDPIPVDVDAVFYNATQRNQSRLGDLLDHEPGTWQGLVRRLFVHDVDCHHQSMLSPAAAEYIGHTLREGVSAEMNRHVNGPELITGDL